jgi:hypothetical protein
MADKNVEAASAAPGEKRSASRPAPALAKASESGDPAVHQILAEIEVARRNEDPDALKDAEKRLADLGFK